MVAIVLTLVHTAGCAYFNTYYNASRIYDEAEQVPRNDDGSVNKGTFAQYDQVIEKCQHLIATYPKSKWVDDAVLLLGKAYYMKGEYDEAIQKFNELEENFPKSDLNTEAQLYLARSYLEQDETERGVSILERLYEKDPKNDAADETLYLLGTNLILIDQEEKALGYLQVLADRFPKTKYRVDADLGVAEIYMGRGEYEKSLAIYDRLSQVKLDDEDKIRYLRSYGEAQVKIGRYDAALETFKRLDRENPKPEVVAEKMLFEGEALLGLGETRKAVDRYQSVSARFPRSKFAAEAAYHSGVIYQEYFDSLDVAKRAFDNVSRHYSRSEYAQEAIRRSVSISKLQRLNASLGQEGGEQAAVLFDLAEVQLFQFNNVEKALAGYQAVVDQYPESAVAPKAAYAIAFIYDRVMQDDLRAREAYGTIVQRYPDSQQAAQAERALAGMTP